MYSKIENFEKDSKWQRSIGEKINMIHFRNGHLHAECDPKTGFCKIHYDRHNPNESLPSLINHLYDSNSGKLLLGVLVVGILDQIFTGGKIRNSVIDSL